MGIGIRGAIERFTLQSPSALISNTQDSILQRAGFADLSQTLRTTVARRAPLFDEFALSSTGPGIVRQTKQDSVGDRRMVIEQEHIHGTRIRIRQTHFPQYLECLRRDLPRIRPEPMGYFQSIMVGLML